MPAYINAIATAVPQHEVHDFYMKFAASQLGALPREQAIFRRLAGKSAIERRYSCLAPSDDPEGGPLDANGVFQRGHFPSTAVRMALYEAHAPALALQAIEGLGEDFDRGAVTHLVVGSCTGYAAPGLDLAIVVQAGLAPSVERTVIGFMGCYSAVNGLKLARHIVRSEPDAVVLVVNLELCTLHFKETADLEWLLTFCLWGDGATAAIVSAEPSGIRLDGFRALLATEASDYMTWRVCDDGFDMFLSGHVPTAIRSTLDSHRAEILDGAGEHNIDLWAVHPGGRSILDAIENLLDLPPPALSPSRQVLREQGNMSSATVMFVLKAMLASARGGENGVAMAFGPGLTAETFTFAVQ